MTKILGNAALYLPLFHALTGCDTTSYFHYKVKKSPRSRVIKSMSKFEFIDDLGCERCISEDSFNACMEFVIYIVYGGKEGEDMIATKVRMYCQQKKKMSSSLPPDTNSMRHDILRKHHQAYIWRRCLQPMVDPLPLEGNGWKMDDDGFVVPVWYTCPQLPPTIQKKARKILIIYVKLPIMYRHWKLRKSLQK